MKEITLSNGEVVTMVKPIVKVLKNAIKKDNEMDQTIYMIATLCNKTEEEIEALGLEDYVPLEKCLKGFFKEAGLTA